MKQTAVGWLEEQIKTSKYFYNLMEDINSRSTVAQFDIFEQAKEMEKKQQGYSEEEVLEIVGNCDGSVLQAKQWFEQFKKK